MLTFVDYPSPTGVPARRPTMRDVAALAGVSLRTISRVINDDPTVADALRAQVRGAVDQLRYRPNLTATHFRRRDGRSFTVGLLLHDVANPFSATVQRAVQDVARDHGCDVLAGSGTDDTDREREVVERLVARRVEGLIIMPAGDDHSYLQAEQMSGMAIVFLDRPPAFLAADSVLAGNRTGAAKAVRHLLEVGTDASLISAIVNPPGRTSSATRVIAMLSADQASLWTGARPSRTVYRQIGRGRHDGAVDSIGPPAALFSAQAAITIGAIRALRSVKQSETTALVGFDDFNTADLLEPGITVVAHDPVAFGSLATEILFRRIEGDRSQIPSTFKKGS